MNRQKYEAELLTTIAGMARNTVSDQTITDERQAMQFVRDHIQGLQVAVQNYNSVCSINQQIDFTRIRDAIDDEVVSDLSFDENISAAKRGWD